ncbi:hypothetical protein M3J09_000289 [Ascochyta lentis]
MRFPASSPGSSCRSICTKLCVSCRGP